MTAAAALLLAAIAAAATDPLDQKASEWKAHGFEVKERISHPVGKLLVAAAVYENGDASENHFEAYVVLHGKAYLGYSHPTQTERLEIEADATGRGFQDLMKDGSRVIAYRATIRALNASSLYILSYKRFKFRIVGRYPEGRFVSNDGDPLLISRELPLGRFLFAGCENFGTVSQTAFRTRLYAPAKGRFAEVSGKHSVFFDAEIARKEAALAVLRGDLGKNAGEYLGLALSLYYDYAAVGEPRKGWERQKDLFSAPGHAPPAVKACFSSLREGLRVQLGIPSDWR